MSDSLNDYANELEADLAHYKESKDNWERAANSAMDELTRVTAERNEALELLRECRPAVQNMRGYIGNLEKWTEIQQRTDALLAKVQPSQPGG